MFNNLIFDFDNTIYDYDLTNKKALHEVFYSISKNFNIDFNKLNLIYKNLKKNITIQFLIKSIA